MRTGRLVSLLLSGVAAASLLTGCGSIDKNATVATLDGTNVPLGVANFAARLEQANADDFYQAYGFGPDVWSSDLYGSGTTMEEDTKESVMESLYDMYVLNAHAADYGVELTEEQKTAIADAAAEFVSDNTPEALAAIGADQATVEEYLTLLTIQRGMRTAIIAETDTNVSDEEAATGSYSYVRVSKLSYTDETGSTVEYTEEDLPELLATVEEFAAKAKKDGLAASVEEYGYTVNSGTFREGDEFVDEVVLPVLLAADEGEVSDVIDTEGSYYVVCVDAKMDEAATEQTRQNLISERENAHYDEVLEGFKAQHTWEVKKGVWNRVSFRNLFTTIPQDTGTDSTDAGTEALDATEQ